MADTFIYPITVTGENSLEYDNENKTSMVEEQQKNDSSDSLNYIMRDKKGNFHNLSQEYLDKIKDYVEIDDKGVYTFRTISSFLNCSKNNTYQNWERVREEMNPQNGKRGNLQYCIVQNFGNEYVDPQVANEIGVKFAHEFLQDYQCVVSTHVNTGLIHNHIEFNATSYVNGKKFNDKLSTIYEIRKISDRLCREYGLSVMEETTSDKARVVVYKDAQGKVHFFEPTERKMKKDEKIFSNSNDYRNTEGYQQGLLYKKSHVEMLKETMDRMVPYAASYEEFIELMKNAGYEVKDKTKSGDWRKHISFKAETWGNYVRDTQVAAVYGEQYSRIGMDNMIKDNVQKGKLQDRADVEDIRRKDNAPRTDDSNIYMYGRIVIEDIDDDYRYRNRKGSFGREQINRSDVEKYIIFDTKEKNRELNTILKQALHPHYDRTKAKDREEYLINRINSNLKTLRFVEEKNVKSITQLNDMVKSLYEQRNLCYIQMKQIADGLKKMNAGIALIERYKNLKRKMDENKLNPDYILFEQKDDVSVIRSLESTLERFKLADEGAQQEFIENYERFTRDFNRLSGALEKVNANIQQYDDCVFNINLIDRHNGNRYAYQIKLYYDNKKNYRSQSQKDENKEENKGENKEKER